MPEILDMIELEEVSFVDNPANAGAKITLFKRDTNSSTSGDSPARKETPMAKMTPEQETRMKNLMDKGYGEEEARRMAMSKADDTSEALAAEVAELEKANTDLTDQLMNLENALKEAGITFNDDGSITKAADPEYVEIDGEKVLKSAVPEPILKRMKADSDRIAALEKRDEEVRLAKRAQDELPNLGGTDAAKGRLLAAVEKMDGGDELMRALKAADAAVSKMFSETGTADDGEPTGAAADLRKMATDYSVEKGVPYEAAYAEVTRAGHGRELLKKLRAESN